MRANKKPHAAVTAAHGHTVPEESPVSGLLNRNKISKEGLNPNIEKSPFLKVKLIFGDPDERPLRRLGNLSPARLKFIERRRITLLYSDRKERAGGARGGTGRLIRGPLSDVSLLSKFLRCIILGHTLPTMAHDLHQVIGQLNGKTFQATASNS
ncbi:hypothetical protein EVAR_17997_1 [Eumeta japonica]|uniref:Uncharacterized protein n=1 Tax=Eumeta variegata TaxID=151549 RepID=A0A4C1Y8G5_EUMVA|nr:hypothetical protein EVAR_17997_1 [Eumeta japonica]